MNRLGGRKKKINLILTIWRNELPLVKFRDFSFSSLPLKSNDRWSEWPSTMMSCSCCWVFSGYFRTSLSATHVTRRLQVFDDSEKKNCIYSFLTLCIDVVIWPYSSSVVIEVKNSRKCIVDFLIPLIRVDIERDLSS